MIRSSTKKAIFKTHDKSLSPKNIPYAVKDAGKVSFLKSIIIPEVVLTPDNAQINTNGLKESKKDEYNGLINCTNDLLWSVNCDLKLMAANNAFLKDVEDLSCIILKPGDDVLVSGIFPKSYLDFLEACYKRAFAGESFRKEIYTPALNKRKESWTDTSFSPIYMHDLVTGVACHSKNITENKIIEEKIRQNEVRLVEAQEVAKLGSWETDLKTFDVIWSFETYRIFEIDPNEFHASHQRFLEFVYPDDRKKVDDAFVNSLNSKSVHTIEHRILTAGGHIKIVEERWRIFHDDDGNPARAVGTCQDITGRKNTEEKMRGSEVRYRSLIEQAIDAICITDASLKIIDVNPRGCQMLGYSKEEFLQLTIADVFITGDLKTKPLKFDELKSGKVISNERRFKRKDGTIVDVEINARILEDGKFVVFARDITERKKAEKELQSAYHEKITILESIDDGFFAIDNNSLVTYWNRKAEELLGQKREDVIGRNLHDMFSRPDSKIFYDNYQKAIRENSTVHFEGFSVRSNKWFAVSAFASENGLSVHFKDVTERKAFEEKEKESELRYRLLVEQATDTICIFDTSFKFIEINPSGCQMFGYTKEEILNLSMSDVLFKEDLKSNPIQMGILKAGKTTSNERRIKRKDGSSVEVEINGKMLEGGRIMIFGRDISERKEAEQKLRQSESKYRTLFEQNMAGVYQSTEKGVILNCNNAFAKMLKYDSPKEILKINASELYFSPAERNDFCSNALTQKKLNNYESVLKCKDGSPLYFIENITLRIDEETGEAIFEGIMIDITEQKHAEIRLKESSERYNLISQATNDMVWDWDLTTGEVFRNREGWKKIFRTAEDEIEKAMTAIWGSRIHPDDKERVQAINDGIHNSFEDSFEIECRVLRDDGTYAYINDRGNIIRNEKGQPVRVIGACQDITERKEAELELKQSNERYNLVSQATNDMVWDWDLITGKVYRNKEGWKKIFRTGDNEIEKELMSDWDNRIHPEDKHKVKLVNDEIKNSVKDFFEVECRMLRDDGSYVYIHDRGNIIRNANGKAVRLIGATQDITQRKEAELKVVKSELRFRSLVQNGSDLITILDEKGYYLYISPAVKQMLGYDHEFITGKNAFTYMHDEDIILAKAHLLKIGNQHSFDMPPLRIKNTAGEWRWLESKVTNLCDNAEIQGYVFNSRDITEKKIAEEEIKKLSIIANETINAVIITDPEEKILWVNEAFTRITEFEAEDVIGKKPGNFLQGEETNPAVVRYMRSKIKKVEPFECDIINYAKSGRKYWLRIQSQPQFDETGKLKYFFAIETDITKEKEAEEILKASEERYRYLFNNNPANIFIWDINSFQILEVNDTAIKSYGYSRTEFLSINVMNLNLTEDYEKIKHFAFIARQKSEFKSEVTCKHINKEGKEMYMNISSHLINFKGSSAILAIATNITEKIFLERELENERLIRQQEITEAVISAQEQERQELGGELHDNINQILAGSRLYLGLAIKDLKLDHPYLTETDILINSAITEIRNLSHSLIPPSLYESELLGAIENIIEVTQKTSGIVINLQAYGFDETTIPDKLKLSIYRIIQEQINNILKHARAQKIIVRLVQDKEKTVLSIKDDGVGFNTGKKAKGVGLMNIKTRASLFNGEVFVISAPGKGCELRVLFN